MEELFISDKSHTVRHNNKDYTLREFIELKRKEHEMDVEERKARNGGHYYGFPFEEEELIWAIQDWFSMVGEFSEDELYYLEAFWDLDQIDIEAICLHND